MTLADAGKSGVKEQRWEDEDVDLTASGSVGEDLVVELKLSPDECQGELQYILFRGDIPMPSDRYQIQKRGNVVQLTLKQSQKEDSGHYALVAKKLSTGLSISGDERLESRHKIRLSIQDPSSVIDEGEPPIFVRRLSDLAVKVGTRTRFLVEIRSSTSPKVTWHKNDEPVQAGSRFSFVHEGNFYCVDVAPVMVDDQGHWTCMAENGGGRSSCTSFLSVIVPKAYKKPEFVDELRALLTETGTVSLECKVVGVPTPVLKWFKDQKEIKAGDVFALTANPDDPTSLGTYTCEAVNCMGTACSSSRVHVMGKGSREGSLKPADALTPSGPLPVFQKILRDESCRIGDSLVLSCQVHVPPWPKTITWYNKEGRVEPSEKYHFIADGHGGYSIEIKGVEAMDEGEWKCVATSDENMKQFSTCHVAMSIPKNYRVPRFMESLKAVLTEEGLVSFECKVVGFPTPLLRWFKDGQELHPGDVYQLTGTNSLGSYCCIARNCMGEAKSIAELTVEDIQNQLNDEERMQLMSSNQAPKFVKGLRSCEARINEDFTFTIQVSVSPEPSLSWYRDDVAIIESEKYRLAQQALGTCNLEVKKLEFMDQAEWKCVAANDFGHSVTSCFLKLVIPKHFKKPKFLESLRAILSEEGAVNLECKVIGVPQPILKWYKDGVELKPGDIHRIISGQDGTCCLGTYTCEATNCMGSVSSSASLLGFEDRVSVRKEEAKEPVTPLHELARNLSLSTIHEERTSQLYDTPQTDHSITMDDRGEVSFSFDGKEVSVSLYETPDLTEEEALQIVEMYADQLSEHITEGNIIELPPMRFTKETSTSGNLLMEAVVIDVSPDYFIPDEEGDDLRTEADVEDVSIMDDQMQSIRSLSYVSSATGETPGDRVPSGSPPSRPPRRKESRESFSSRSERSEKSLPKGFDWSESYHSAKEPSVQAQTSLQGQDDSGEAFTDALSSSGAGRSKAEESKDIYASFVEQNIEKIPLDETMMEISKQELKAEGTIATQIGEALIEEVPVKRKKKKRDKQQSAKGSRTPSLSSKASSEESYSFEVEEKERRRSSRNGKDRRGSASSNKSGKGRRSRSGSESGKFESAVSTDPRRRESDATIMVDDVRIEQIEEMGYIEPVVDQIEPAYVREREGLEERPNSATTEVSTIDSEKSMSRTNKERLLDNVYKLSEPIISLRSALVDMDSLLPLLRTQGSPADVERSQIEIAERIVVPVENLCEQVSAIETKALKSAGDRSLAQNVRISLLEAIGGPTEELLRGIELIRRHSGQQDPKSSLIVIESLTDPVDEILVGLTRIEQELTSREGAESPMIQMEKPIALERMYRAVERLGENVANITVRNIIFGDESTSCSVIERLQSIYQSLEAFLSTVPLSEVSGALENNVDTLVVETLVRPLEELSRNLNIFGSANVETRSEQDIVVDNLEKSMIEMRTRLEALTVALDTYEKESGEQGITELHADLVKFLRYTMDDAVERLEKLKLKKKRVTQETTSKKSFTATSFDEQSRLDDDELAIESTVESSEPEESNVLQELAEEAAAIMKTVTVPSIAAAEMAETESQLPKRSRLLSQTEEKSSTETEEILASERDEKKELIEEKFAEEIAGGSSSPEKRAHKARELDTGLSLPEMLLDPLIDVQANLSDVISDFESQESAEESSLPGGSELAACLTELRESVATAAHKATTLKSASTVDALVDLREPLLDLQLAMTSAVSPEEVKLIREATVPLAELKVIVAAAITSSQTSEASQIQMKSVLRMLEDIEAEVTKVTTPVVVPVPPVASETRESKSITMKPPEEVERAAVALAGVHFALSTALERVMSQAIETNDISSSQRARDPSKRMAEESAASNLIVSIEELRQSVGTLAIALGTPVASTENNDRYSYGVLFDELTKLEEPLLNLQKVLLTEQHGPDDRHVLNDLASPIRSLKEVVQDVTREIGDGSTPNVLELIEDVEKDVTLIAMEALKKALAVKSKTSDDDGRASVSSSSKPGEVPAIISKWLDPIEDWLTSTAEESNEMEEYRGKSVIAPAVDDLKRELLKIAIQTSYSEPPSDVALIESLTELQEPLTRVCQVLNECHEPENLDIIEGLVQPTKHLLGTILDASLTHEAGKILRPVLEAIEELENQIPLTMKRAIYERELQRVVRSMTPEEPETLIAKEIPEMYGETSGRSGISEKPEMHESSVENWRKIASGASESEVEMEERAEALYHDSTPLEDTVEGIKVVKSVEERAEMSEVSAKKGKSKREAESEGGSSKFEESLKEQAGTSKLEAEQEKFQKVEESEKERAEITKVGVEEEKLLKSVESQAKMETVETESEKQQSETKITAEQEKLKERAGSDAKLKSVMAESEKEKAESKIEVEQEKSLESEDRVKEAKSEIEDKVSSEQEKLQKLSKSKNLQSETVEVITVDNRPFSETITSLESAQTGEASASDTTRADQLDLWTLTLLGPLDRLGNAVLSLDRSIDELAHGLLCRPLDSLHKQIEIAESQFNRPIGQSLENDVETIIEGFLSPVNQLHSALGAAVDVWNDEQPRIVVRDLLRSIADSSTELCELLGTLRKKLIVQSANQSLQAQQEDASLVETINAVIAPLEDVRNLIEEALRSLEFVDSNEKIETSDSLLEGIQGENVAVQKISESEMIRESHDLAVKSLEEKAKIVEDVELARASVSKMEALADIRTEETLVAEELEVVFGREEESGKIEKAREVIEESVQDKISTFKPEVVTALGRGSKGKEDSLDIEETTAKPLEELIEAIVDSSGPRHVSSSPEDYQSITPDVSEENVGKSQTFVAEESIAASADTESVAEFGVEKFKKDKAEILAGENLSTAETLESVKISENQENLAKSLSTEVAAEFLQEIGMEGQKKEGAKILAGENLSRIEIIAGPEIGEIARQAVAEVLAKASEAGVAETSQTEVKLQALRQAETSQDNTQEEILGEARADNLQEEKATLLTGESLSKAEAKEQKSLVLESPAVSQENVLVEDVEEILTERLEKEKAQLCEGESLATAGVIDAPETKIKTRDAKLSELEKEIVEESIQELSSGKVEQQTADLRESENLAKAGVTDTPETKIKARDAKLSELEPEIAEESVQEIITQKMEQQKAELREDESLAKAGFVDAPEMKMKAADAELSELESEVAGEGLQDISSEKIEQQKAELREGEGLAKAGVTDAPEMKIRARDAELSELEPEVTEDGLRDISSERIEQQKAELREGESLAKAGVTDVPEMKINTRDAELSELEPEMAGECLQEIPFGKIEQQKAELREGESLATAGVTDVSEMKINTRDAELLELEPEVAGECLQEISFGKIEQQKAELREGESLAKAGVIDAPETRLKEISQTADISEESAQELLVEKSEQQRAELREGESLLKAGITDVPETKIKAIDADVSKSVPEVVEESVQKIPIDALEKQTAELREGEGLAKARVDAPETRKAGKIETAEIMQENLQEIPKEQSGMQKAGVSVEELRHIAEIAKIEAIEIAKLSEQHVIEAGESAIIEIVETPTHKIFKVKKEGTSKGESEEIVEKIVVKPVEEIVAMEDQNIIEIVETPTEKVLKLKIPVERKDGVVEDVIEEIIVKKPVEGWAKSLVEEEERAFSVSQAKIQEFATANISADLVQESDEKRQTVNEDDEKMSAKDSEVELKRELLKEEEEGKLVIMKREEAEHLLREETQKLEEETDTRIEREKQEAERLKHEKSERLKREEENERKMEAEKVEREEIERQEKVREEKERLKLEEAKSLELEKVERAKRDEEEKLRKEEAERLEREEFERQEKAKAETERLKKEEEEKLRKEEAERLERIECERREKEKQEVERIQREEAERLRKEDEAARLEREELERQEKENQERLRREEDERLRKQETERLEREERERQEKAEQEKAERLKREEAERLRKEEAERIEREEHERQEKARKEAERLQREEAEKLEKEESERKKKEAERVRKEEAEKMERVELERKEREAERLRKEEAERLEKEELERKEKEADRLRKEEAERLEKEELERKEKEADRLKKEEAERLKKEELEREEREAEKLRKEEAERLKKEELERKKQEAEKAKKEETERLEKEELERKKEEAKKAKKDEAERLEREESEHKKREAEKLKQEELARAKKEEEERLIKEEAQRMEKEELERKEREAERFKQEELERVKKEEEERVKKIEAERLEREKLEREKQEAERLKQEELACAKREEEERLKKEEAEKLEKEKLERAKKDEEERLKKETAERLEKDKLERARKEEEERLEREKAEKIKQEELERKKQEDERKKQGELERAKKEEEERLKKEEAVRLEREELERKKEADRLKQEELERSKKEEEDRLKKEKLEKEKEEAERLKKEDAAKLEREKLEKEKAEAERLKKEEATKLEKEKLEKEKQEAERVKKEEAAKLEREKLEKEQKEAERVKKEEALKLERKKLEKEKEEAEHLKKEEAARLEKVKLEKEREEVERLKKEEAAKLEREKLEKEKEEAERLKKEKAARLEKEKLEKEREEVERLKKEEAAKLEREKLEKEKEKAERVKKEEAAKLEKEKLEKEKAETAKLEKEKLEKEKAEAAKLEKEKLEKEKAEAAKLEKEKLEKEKAEAAKLEKEKLEKEKEEVVKLEKEKLEREKKEVERLKKEEAAKLEKEKLEKEKEEAELLKKEEAANLAKEKVEKEKEEAERLKKEDEEKLKKEEDERLKRQEAEKLEKEKGEAERLKNEELERQQKEVAERLKEEEQEHRRREEVETLEKRELMLEQEAEADRLKRKEAKRQEKEEAKRMKKEDSKEESPRISKKEDSKEGSRRSSKKEDSKDESKRLKKEDSKLESRRSSKIEDSKEDSRRSSRSEEAKDETKRLKKEDSKVESRRRSKIEDSKEDSRRSSRSEDAKDKAKPLKKEDSKVESRRSSKIEDSKEGSRRSSKSEDARDEAKRLKKEDSKDDSRRSSKKDDSKVESKRLKKDDPKEESKRLQKEDSKEESKRLQKEDSNEEPKQLKKEDSKEESRRLKKSDSKDEPRRISKKLSKEKTLGTEDEQARIAPKRHEDGDDDEKTPINSEKEMREKSNQRHVRLHEETSSDHEPRSSSTIRTDSEMDSEYSESSKSVISRDQGLPEKSRRQRDNQQAAIEIDYEISTERLERREADRQYLGKMRDETLSSDDRHYTPHYSAMSRIHEFTPGPRDRGKKPSFCTKLTDRTAAEASRIKLTCTVLGDPEPTVYWTKDGKELPNSSNRHCTIEENGMLSLELYAALPKDSGEYSCVARNIHGQAYTEAKLKVYAGYEPSPALPTFTRSIKDTYRSAENELVLECRVRGQPSPKITWLKDGQILQIGDRYQQCDLGDGICRLRISHPDFYDSGLYTCRAENDTKISDCTSHVVNFDGKGTEHGAGWRGSYRNLTSSDRDTGRPRFSSHLTDHSVPAGGTIALQVEVKGVPPPDITWMRGDKREPISAYKARTFADSGVYTLIVPEATESETGTYVCRASNAYGYVDTAANVEVISSSSSEGGKPAMFVFRPAETMIHVTVGEDVSVSFRANGVPKPRIVWMKGLRDITNGPRSYKESSDDYVRLTLKRALVSDEGTYCIMAKNRYGCDRTFYTVKVKQRARSLTPSPDWGTLDTDNLLTNIHDTERSYLKQVPGPITSEPVVVDGGRNWLALSWGKAVQHGPAPVVAYRVDAWLLGGEGGARWAELGITPVNAFDAFNLRPGGEYKFRIVPRNRYGWGESVTMTSSVTVREVVKFPEFSKILTGQLKALRGETLRLECEVRSESKADVKWYRDTTDIDAIQDPRYMTHYNGSKCTVTVQSIKEIDSGRYVCEATNPAGRVSTFARVQVVTDPKIVEADEKLRRMRTLEPSNEERPPEFTMRLRDRRVQMTYPVRLTCQVSGHPEPEVTWYKNREEIFQDDNVSFWDDESHFHTLEISHSTVEDSGVYMAKARNFNGSVSCRCNLVVDKGIRAYVAPEFFRHLDAVYTVKSGGELRMTAQIEAYPTVGIVWHRDGHRLRPSRSAVMTLNHDGSVELSLGYVTPRDAGLYCCTATNEVGQTESTTRVTVVGSTDEELTSISQSLPDVVESLDVPYSKEPLFVTKPLSTEAIEGDTVIILCEVVGDPKPEVIWLRDFLRPDYYRDAAHFRRVGAGPQYRLEIPYAKLDFTGAYSVIAKNCHGEAKAIISLQIYARGQGKSDSSMEQATVKHGNVQTLPSIKRPLRDLRCCDGDAVTLICRVHATPEPDVRWEKSGKLLPLGDDFVADFDGETARLSIQHVYPEDEGEYTCVAYNDLGKAFTSACLIVDVPEGKESALSRRLIRPIGLLSAESTPISTPRSTPIRSLSPACVSSRRELKPAVRTPRGQSIGRRPRLPTGPKFYAVPHNRVAEEGETVRFQCAIAGHPTPWVTWDKDGVPVTPTARISLKEKDDVRILEIAEINHEDAGLYRITLENDVGRTEATARLEIIKGRHGSVTRTVRTRSASPRTYSIYSRSPITSAVRGDTHLRPSINDSMSGRGGTLSPTLPRWHHRNGKSPMESPEPARRMNKQTRTSINNGLTHPAKPQNLKIPVPAKPRSSSVPRQNLSPREIPVNPARQTKKSPGQRGTSEGMIRSNKNSRTTTTTTTMTTTNGSMIPKRLPISRSRSPKVIGRVATESSQESKDFINSGQSKTLTMPEILKDKVVVAENDEAIEFTALRDHDEQISKTSLPPAVELLPPAVELLPLSKNEIETENSRLIVEETREPRPPVILAAPADVIALRGTKVTLLATFDGEPQPRVRWLRRGRDVRLDDKAEIETSRGLTCLTLEGVTTEQTGKYAVTLENIAGRDCRYVNVTVEGVPDPPAGTPCVQSITRSGKAIVTWRSPSYDGGCAVTGYSVEMKRAEEPCWIAVAEARHSLSHTVTGLVQEDTYSFRVRAENAHGVSEPSAISDAVTVPGENDEEIGGQVFTAEINQIEIEEEEEEFEPAFEARIVSPEDGRLFAERYEVMEELGKGRYGIVRRIVEKSTGLNLAAKFVRTIKAKDRQQVHEEIGIMNTLRHPKLLRLAAAFENPKEMIMVTEYISGGELFERVVADDFTLTEKDSIQFVKQICEGVEYMHTHSVVHLDLKPENIMCHTRTSHRIKLIDFGLAQTLNPDTPIRVLFGTPEFIPPEIIGFEPIGTESDMWSVGVICYVLLTGLSPFMGDNDAETFANITRADFDFDDKAFAAISLEAKDFISALLVKRKELRMSAKQCLEHPWLAQQAESMSRVALPTDKLKKFIVRRKWQKTGNAIRALGRMAILSANTRRNLSAESSPTKTDFGDELFVDVAGNVDGFKPVVEDIAVSECREKLSGTMEEDGATASVKNDENFHSPEVERAPEVKTTRKLDQSKYDDSPNVISVEENCLTVTELEDIQDYEINEIEDNSPLIQEIDDFIENDETTKANLATDFSIEEVTSELFDEIERNTTDLDSDVTSSSYFNETMRKESFSSFANLDIIEPGTVETGRAVEAERNLGVEESDRSGQHERGNEEEKPEDEKKPRACTRRITSPVYFSEDRTEGHEATSRTPVVTKAWCKTNNSMPGDEEDEIARLTGYGRPRPFVRTGSVSRTAKMFEREEETSSSSLRHQQNSINRTTPMVPEARPQNERIRKAFAFWNK